MDNKGSQTDWARLRALTDAEVEAAIADDTDSYPLEKSDLLGRKGASFSYQIYQDEGGSWRWRLLSADGMAMAVGAQAYETRQAVQAAILILRDAMIGARSRAA